MEPVLNDSKKCGLLYGEGVGIEGGDRTSSKRQQKMWPSLRWRGWGWNLFQTTAKCVDFFTGEGVGIEGGNGTSSKRH